MRVHSLRAVPKEGVPVMSEESPALSCKLPSIMNRWFVRFNPLYFFSALCVLAGVCLVSRGLDEIHARSGRMMLAGTVQLYEVVLLVCAALLYRVANQKRPAVILALLEVFFLFDWTFQTEVLAGQGVHGLVLAAGWFTLAAFKLVALAWIFGLRVSRRAAAVALLAFAGVAFGPHLMQLAAGHRQAAHLAATWFGAAVVALAVLAPPRVWGRRPLDAWGRLVLRRSAAAFWILGGLFYAVHLAGWAMQFELSLTLAHLVPFLMLSALLIRHEAVAWTGAVTAVIISLAEPSMLAPTSIVAAAVLGLCAYRMGEKRLWFGAVLSAELAAWTLGWSGQGLPASLLLVHVAAAVVLACMALRWRSWAAGVAVAIALAPAAHAHMPRNILEWGIALLAAGFLALIVGVAISWDRRGKKPLGEAQVPEGLESA